MLPHGSRCQRMLLGKILKWWSIELSNIYVIEKHSGLEDGSILSRQPLSSIAARLSGNLPRVHQLSLSSQRRSRNKRILLIRNQQKTWAHPLR